MRNTLIPTTSILIYLISCASIPASTKTSNLDNDPNNPSRQTTLSSKQDNQDEIATVTTNGSEISKETDGPPAPNLEATTFELTQTKESTLEPSGSETDEHGRKSNLTKEMIPVSCPDLRECVSEGIAPLTEEVTRFENLNMELEKWVNQANELIEPLKKENESLLSLSKENQNLTFRLAQANRKNSNLDGQIQKLLKNIEEKEKILAELKMFIRSQKDFEAAFEAYNKNNKIVFDTIENLSKAGYQVSTFEYFPEGREISLNEDGHLILKWGFAPATPNLDPKKQLDSMLGTIKNLNRSGLAVNTFSVIPGSFMTYKDEHISLPKYRGPVPFLLVDFPISETQSE